MISERCTLHSPRNGTSSGCERCQSWRASVHSCARRRSKLRWHADDRAGHDPGCDRRDFAGGHCDHGLVEQLHAGRFETYTRPARGFAAWPTNDGLTVVIAGWPFAEMRANRNDIEGNFLRAIELAPGFAQRLRAAHRESRFVGTAVPNYFRRPFGPGWALVGDAGCNLDFITGQGMQDAFRDAEPCAVALDESFAGATPFDVAMREYQLRRDARVLPMYEFTAQLASLGLPSPEMQQLLGAIHGNQEAMDGFVRVMAGATSPAEFFSDANVARNLEAAAAA